MYRILVSFDYEPTGKRYNAGETDALKGWKKAQITSAVRKGLVVEVGAQEEIEWQKDKL